MIDQNLPSQEGNLSAAQPAAVPPVQEPVVAPSPTVVVPNNGGGVPKWFYFIFGLTFIVFFLVTTLLVLQLIPKQQANSDILPTKTPQVTSTSKLPSLTPAVSDLAVTKLNNLGTEDEVVSIEADLKNTDLLVLDQGLETVEAQVAASPN